MFDIQAALETRAHLSSEFGQKNIQTPSKFKVVENNHRAYKWLAEIRARSQVSHGFDNFGGFLVVTQAANEYLPSILSDYRSSMSDRGLEFLEDTLAYLTGKPRKQPLEQVFLLIDDEERYLSKTRRSQIYTLIDDHFMLLNTTRGEKPVAGDYISMWCNKYRGMEDLAWTIYFLLVCDNLNP